MSYKLKGGRRVALTIAMSAGLVFGVAGTSGAADIPGGTTATASKGTFRAALTTDDPTTQTLGYSTALSADGNRAVTGAPAAGGYNGAVYVYDYAKAAKSWGNPTALTVPGLRYGELGFSVAISADGNTIVAAAPFQSGKHIFVFTHSATGWTQTAALDAPGDTGAVGEQVAVSGDGNTIVAGSPFYNTLRGAVYTFTNSDSGWSAPTRLVATDGQPFDIFGYSLALSSDGSTLAVGAKGYSKSQGAVYTFSRQDSGWVQTVKLIGDDGAAGNGFGWSVALSGDGQTLITASPYRGTGVGYAYTNKDGAWTASSTLQPTEQAQFKGDGRSVAISNDASTVVLGEIGRNSLSGAGEVFTRSGDGYTSSAMMVPSEYVGPSFPEGAGTSVSLSADGSEAALGGPSVDQQFPAGAMYIYDTAAPKALDPNATQTTSAPTPSASKKDARKPLDLSNKHELSAAATKGKAHPIIGEPHKTASVCGDPTAAAATCGVEILTDTTRRSFVTPDAVDGLGATDLQKAYGLTGPSKDTVVAVVDAYANPTAVDSLNTYRAQYGLGPADLTQVNQNGGSQLPDANEGWGVEEMLDLEMVSAACPDCKILYVGANSPSFDDLGTAVNTAVKLGAKVVSNSYGGNEDSSLLAMQDKYYNHPGVAITASTGDSGYGVSMPASFGTVIAVGGTSLTLNPDGTRKSETAWDGAGSGCSRVVAKPTWQKDKFCTNRTVADVSAVADPDTGVAVYDAAGLGGWSVVGGTSASAPLIGGIYGRTGDTAGYPAKRLYTAPKGSFFDPSGNVVNGTCSSVYLCSDVHGYDGPTGVGSPIGTAAF